MTDSKNQDAVHHTLTLPVPPRRAFAVFTESFGDWWPPAYTWSQDVLVAIRIEPKEGGRCFERGPHGFECDWGRVLAWDPPHRLEFTWQIGPNRVPEPDPEKSSRVEVRFVPKGTASTRVKLTHRGFSRHGEGGAAYRAGMDSPQGWSYILERYADACTAASNL